MGKGVDLFPGTTDRACMITGSRDAILAGLSFILKRIFLKQRAPALGADVPDDEIDESEMLMVGDSSVLYCLTGLLFFASFG